MTSRANRAADSEIPDDAQSVYDGRHHLGWTFRRGKAFEAVRYDRASLGVFDTLL
jgi:hypothetical protein